MIKDKICNKRGFDLMTTVTVCKRWVISTRSIVLSTSAQRNVQVTWNLDLDQTSVAHTHIDSVQRQMWCISLFVANLDFIDNFTSLVDITLSYYLQYTIYDLRKWMWTFVTCLSVCDCKILTFIFLKDYIVLESLDCYFVCKIFQPLCVAFFQRRL